MFYEASTKTSTGKVFVVILLFPLLSMLSALWGVFVFLLRLNHLPFFSRAENAEQIHSLIQNYIYNLQICNSLFETIIQFKTEQMLIFNQSCQSIDVVSVLWQRYDAEDVFIVLISSTKSYPSFVCPRPMWEYTSLGDTLSFQMESQHHLMVGIGMELHVHIWGQFKWIMIILLVLWLLFYF